MKCKRCSQSSNKLKKYIFYSGNELYSETFGFLCQTTTTRYNVNPILTFVPLCPKCIAKNRIVYAVRALALAVLTVLG